MTQDEIADTYQEANGWSPRGYPNTMAELEAFAKLVAAKEREVCLKLCERNHFAIFAAKAIRARGKE